MKYSIPVTALFVSALVSCGTSVPQPESSDLKSEVLPQATASYGGYTIYIENTASISIKQTIKNQGASQLQLVIAMAEEKTLDPRNWPLGFGDGKTGDAANFGLYKMNWYMIRLAMRDMWPNDTFVRSLDYDDYNKLWPGTSQTIAQRINTDHAMATRILQAAMAKWSTAEPKADPLDPRKGTANNFWAGHRCGQTGLEGRSCTDRSYNNEIGYYYKGVMAINGYINASQARRDTLWSTNIRYGANLFPI
ncbi:hypothetical protein [Deinococcus misasensis]|uniref:hypothetical protein n=1 Tax=Deinococcus misasensis TaxID=392413 RepID=UPI00054CE474|nr:hypothetical protein [Deinococcus misasensis]